MKCADLPRRLFQVLPTASHRRPRRRRLTFESFEDKLLLSAFYVAPGGSNSAKGSALHPWATIQKAANMVAPGDTVYVAPGQYNVPVTTNRSGTAVAPITFISTTQWGATINTKGSESQYCWTNKNNYVDIEGFDISAPGDTEARIGILNYGSYCNMIGNRVHDIPATSDPSDGGAGIDNATYTSTGNNIIGNWVFNIGVISSGSANTVHGIYLSAYGGLVCNNIVYNNRGCGIQAWHNAQGATISNNLVWGNGHFGILIGAGDTGYTVGAGDKFIVTNNTVIYNVGESIVEENDNDNGGEFVQSVNVYVSNLCYGNARDTYNIYETGVAPPLMVNPLLVNYQANGTGDYHLTAGSPCINAGTSLGADTTDLDEVARPQIRSSGNGYDIGPYEYQTFRHHTSDSDQCEFWEQGKWAIGLLQLLCCDQYGDVHSHSQPVAYSTSYTATISGATDAAGNTMTGPFSWSFTTTDALLGARKKSSTV